MIVSHQWLRDYTAVSDDHDELVDRLTMSGLNHEGSEAVGNDTAIDLEVTSNRADCLGHIGVAREIAALYELPLGIPDPQPVEKGPDVSSLCSVGIECPERCFRYTARLIRGVQVGPSPPWLVDRLKAVGVASINNIVDISNYVMFECGQPTHAFDFAKIAGGRIIVREPKKGESIEAIDHRTYELPSSCCVIADESSPVCIGGIMGGADSEVSDATTDVLLEAAYFDPMTVRSAARTLNLHSPSSFRFERNIDSHQLDWASRRCCELILELAGGELCSGIIDVGRPAPQPPSLTLRTSQIERVLGIEIPLGEALAIFERLGLQVMEHSDEKITVTPPTWRKDLTREVDLIEEVGRIWGYDRVPDDAAVPMVASLRTKPDRVMQKVRSVLCAAGMDEAMTPTAVPQPWSELFSPWTRAEAIQISQPMLGVLEKASQSIGSVNLVRRSLLPSLVEARRINDFRSNTDVELFETAHVYLAESKTGLPREPMMLGMVSHRDYLTLKGVVEAIVQQLNPSCFVSVSDFENSFLDIDRSGELKIGSQTLGFIGELSESAMTAFRLRSTTTVAEIQMSVLEELAVLVPVHSDQSRFQAISRDFNFIVDNRVHWQDLRETVSQSGGELCEAIWYRETFRNPDKDGPGKKRLLMSVVLRSATETLSGEQADEVCQQIVNACRDQHSAELVA